MNEVEIVGTFSLGLIIGGGLILILESANSKESIYKSLYNLTLDEWEVCKEIYETKIRQLESQIEQYKKLSDLNLIKDSLSSKFALDLSECIKRGIKAKKSKK